MPDDLRSITQTSVTFRIASNVTYLRAIALGMVTCLLFSAAAPAIAGSASDIRKGKSRQAPTSYYTDAPGPVDVGAYPHVDITGRGQFYSQADIDSINYANRVEAGLASPTPSPAYDPNALGDTGDNQALLGRPDPLPRNVPGALKVGGVSLSEMLASTRPSFAAKGLITAKLKQGGPPTDGGGGVITPPGQVGPRPGEPFPWEGSGPGGGSSAARGYLNTQTGNRLTVLPIVAWRIPGGMSLGLTLYHNSQDNLDIGWGQNWRSSFDMRLVHTGPAAYNQADTVSVTYPTGKRITFTRRANNGTINSGVYFAPTGMYDYVSRNLGSWSLRTPDQIVYAFDPVSGYLTSISDRYHNPITINRTGSGPIQSVSDSAGNAITLQQGGTSPSAGHYISATTPSGKIYNFNMRYQSFNSYMVVLDSVQWPQLGSSNYRESFGYDFAGGIVGEQDRSGASYHFVYDQTERLTSFSYPVNFYTVPVSQTGNNGALTYNYTYGGTSTTLTDPYSKTIIDNYDGGTLRSEVDQAGYSQTYTYDIRYNVSQLVDARGNISNFTYDVFGNIASAQDARQTSAGVNNAWTYNSYNDPLTARDARGATTTYNRDPRTGLVMSTTDGLNNLLASFTYNANGDVATVSTENATTTINYNAQGRPVSVATPDQTYNVSYASILPGLPSSVTDGLGRATNLSYDNWGRATSVQRADGANASVSLDAMNRAYAYSDFMGRVSQTTYDAAGRVTSSQNPRGDTMSYFWYDLSRLATVRDGNGSGHETNYNYTPRGEEYTMLLADNSVEMSQYDGNGNQTSRYNGQDPMTHYTYDAADNQTAITYPSGTPTSLSYDYDGRPTAMTDGSGTSAWTYDLGDRMTQFSSPQGVVNFAYDQWGRRTQLDEGGGVAIRYGYNSHRLATITKMPENEVTSFSYDTIGRLAGQANSNGTSASFGYDVLDQLTSLNHTGPGNASLLSEAYSYNAAGNMITKVSNGVNTYYAYDAADQLVQENSPAVSFNESYTYDHNGNRISRSFNGATELYLYDAADKLARVTSYDYQTKKTYGYDAAGRTTSVAYGPLSGDPVGTTLLTYDFEDRITSITGSAGNSSYAYNGIDARVSKTDPSGTSTYLRAGAGVTEPVLSDGTATYNPGISRHTLAGTTTEHQDFLGTNKVETNGSGTLTGTRQHNAFGRLVSTTGTPVGPFGFAGSSGYQEDASGLKLLGYRYYDSSTGRFLTRDPARDGDNWYAYCDNDPTYFLDEDGNQALPAPLAGPTLTVVEGGGAAASAPVGLIAAAALGGWALGRWIDHETGISTSLGNLLGGNVDELPAPPHRPRSSEHKKNKRKSTRQKHQKGGARKDREQAAKEARINEIIRRKKGGGGGNNNSPPPSGYSQKPPSKKRRHGSHSRLKSAS